MALLSCKSCGEDFNHEEQVIVVYEPGTSKEPRSHGTSQARDAPVAFLYHRACYAAAGNVIPPRD